MRQGKLKGVRVRKFGLEFLSCRPPSPFLLKRCSGFSLCNPTAAVASALVYMHRSAFFFLVRQARILHARRPCTAARIAFRAGFKGGNPPPPGSAMGRSGFPPRAFRWSNPAAAGDPKLLPASFYGEGGREEEALAGSEPPGR